MRGVSAGGFDLPAGAGNGGGGGKSRGVSTGGFGDSRAPASKALAGNGAGVVKAAGFGDATEPVASAPAAGALVKTAGFNAFEGSVAAPAAKAVQAKPTITPVEIISKPKPVYTAEAREERLEGEVLLEVLFCASGQVKVEKVVRGLGKGLDESAMAAASQIHFHPASRDGNPIDMRGIVHIVFKLS